MEIIITTLPDGMKVAQPEDSIGINSEIYDHEAYTKYREITEDDVVIDLGAHVGIFTLKAAAKAKKVIAIEPDPVNYELLISNIKRNKLENVSTLNIAVSDFRGTAKLHTGCASVFPTITPEFISRRKYDGHIIVKVRTLDEILEKSGVEKVDFIKIDVEGAELQVLRGARKTIANKTHIYLAIAAEHYTLQPIHISNFLRNKGFTCKEFFIRSQHSHHVYASRDP